jgi:hypothetical protein
VPTFFRALLLITGLLLMVTIPVLVLAWRKNRTRLAIRFMAVAVAIGTFFGFAAAGSERLRDSCRESGSISCFDSGYTGFLFLVVSLYVVAALSATYILARQ